MFDRVQNLPQILSIPGFWICLWFWICQGFEYTRVLNMPGFCICLWYWICQGVEYTRVLNMLGLHRVLSMSEYFLGMSFMLFNQLGTKVISKNIILPLQKALWTSLKLLQKVENCYAIVKMFSSAAGFSTRFAHFSLQYNFFTLIWGLGPWCSMLKTLEMHRKSRQ